MVDFFVSPHPYAVCRSLEGKGISLQKPVLLQSVALTKQKYAHILLFMENHSDQQERERIANLAATCVCINLRRASRTVTNYYDSLLAQVSDLRLSQVITLVVLYLAGPQTINVLAEIMALDRTTIGRNLRPLAQKGLLTLTPGSDQRTRVVTLTTQGEESLLHVVPQWEQAQAHIVEAMGQVQVAALHAQLSTVTEHARQP
jgi:DNA-binding MarR family transcriptional regulator